MPERNSWLNICFRLYLAKAQRRLPMNGDLLLSEVEG